MSVAIRAITRLQDADDLNVSLGVGVDEYALTYDHDTGKFVLRAPFAGLLATGATTGATSQAQAFTNGIVGPSWRPSANSTTALQLQKADGTSVLNVDTTNGRVGIGTTAPGQMLHVHGGIIKLTSATENAYLFQGFTTGGSTDNIGIAMHDGANSTSPYLWIAVSNSSWGGPVNRMVIASTKNGGVTKDLWIYANDTVPSAPNLAVQANTGRVGIGTTAPATRLDIDAGALTMAEMTAPTGAANKATLYTKDNGSGKTQLCVKLGDDVEIVLATQA